MLVRSRVMFTLFIKSLLTAIRGLIGRLLITNEVDNSVDSGDTEPTVIIYDDNYYIKMED